MVKVITMKVITTMTSTITIVANIFCTHEREVRECFHVLQDIQRKPSKGKHIWDKMCKQQNKNQLNCSVEHLARSLQTKWGHHQTQCNNFFDNYRLVVALCEFELMLRTQYIKLLNFTKSIHSKGYGCSFVHCCCCFTTSMLGRHVKIFLKPLQ